VKHMSRGKPEASAATFGILSYVPMRIVEVELGQPLPPISACDEETGHTYERALCLVRLHTQPLGMLELPLDV
jgi:hypothetical protein